MSYPYSGVLTDRAGGNVLYDPRYYFPALKDREIFGFITCTVVVCLALLVPYVSYWRVQKRKEALKYLGGFVSMYLWCVIMVCNFGKEWQRGSVITTTQYSPSNPVQIEAEVGLHIGLRGINVTLVGQPVNQANETIDYNEIFSWEWQQGILGHGPYGGRISREVHEATARGVPYPILWVAEWFTLEGEYIHWGRYYRTSGWYVHILMWLAMCIWGITNLMFLTSAFHGAMGLIALGVTMIMACIVFSGLAASNYNPLVINFPDGQITLSYGWSFILNLVNGILCVIGGIIIAIIAKWPKQYFFVEEPHLVIKSEVIHMNDEEMIDIKEGKGTEDSFDLMPDVKQLPVEKDSLTMDGEGKIPSSPKKKKKTVTISEYTEE